MKRRFCEGWKSKEDQIIDEEIEETEKIPDKIMKNEKIEEEKEITTLITTKTAIIPNISPNNDEFSEFSNISEENSSTSKTNLLMAAQLGIKGPAPVGEQPVDKMFNSQLIKEISQHPALFDFTCDGYKSIEARNKNWEEVSFNSGRPLEFIRTRWKTLRDRFKKEVRRIKQQQLQQPENAFNDAFNGCWHHFEEMLFLLPFVRDKIEEVIPSYSTNKDDEGEHLLSTDGTTINSSQAFIQSYKLAKQRQLNSSNLNSENKQQQMQSSTAAILDLAMNAVNKCNNENEKIEEEEKEENNNNNEINKRGGENEFIKNKNNKTIYRQSFSSIRYPKIFEKQQQYINNNQQKINNNKFPQIINSEIYENEDNEDILFCRIILKKLEKLDERIKETAKIKIMELLINLQYGE